MNRVLRHSIEKHAKKKSSSENAPTNLYFLGYVDAMKALLFTLPKSEMKEVLERYSGKVPKPLNQQFPARRSKEEAVEVYQTRRKMKKTSLFPSGLFL